MFLYLYNKHDGNAVGGGTYRGQRPLIVDKYEHQVKVAAAIAAGDD